MIVLYTLYPRRLNLNGDQGNIRVLGQRLAWLGQDSRVIELDSLAGLQGFSEAFSQDPDGKFLLVGHGSLASLESLKAEAPEMRELILEMVRAGLAGIAVGSGYELLQPDFSRGARISKYAKVPASDSVPELFGYINTDTDLAPVAELGPNFLATLVHGPVLARTPQLADLFISRLGVNSVQNDRSAEVDRFAAGANNH